MDRLIPNDPPRPLSQLDVEAAFLRRQALSGRTVAELDRRYWNFVRALPREEALLAIDRSGFTGTGPSMPLRSVGDLGFAVGIPRAFCAAFPCLSEERVITVEEAWLFLMLGMLLRDNMTDGQVPPSIQLDALQFKLFARARRVFQELVGDREEFWLSLGLYEQQTVEALKLEAYYRCHPSAYEELAQARLIGAGKLALYKAIPCAMAVQCDEFQSLPQFERSLDCLAAGRQLFDDVADWEEDLARGHYTFPLAQAVRLLEVQGLPASATAVRTIIHNAIILEDMLRQAADWHEEALAAVDGIPCDGWRGLVGGSLSECRSYHRNLIAYRITFLAKQSRPANSQLSRDTQLNGFTK